MEYCVWLSLNAWISILEELAKGRMPLSIMVKIKLLSGFVTVLQSLHTPVFLFCFIKTFDLSSFEENYIKYAKKYFKTTLLIRTLRCMYYSWVAVQ